MILTAVAFSPPTMSWKKKWRWLSFSVLFVGLVFVMFLMEAPSMEYNEVEKRVEMKKVKAMRDAILVTSVLV